MSLQKDCLALGLETETQGLGYHTPKDGLISKAYVKRPYDLSRSIGYRFRAGMIVEEILQSLGLTSDSYAYLESMFYQEMKYVQHLSELDKQILCLLYEPALIPDGEFAQFEEDFEDVLYHINGGKKFTKFLRKENVSKKTLMNIYQYGLAKETATKPGSINTEAMITSSKW